MNDVIPILIVVVLIGGLVGVAYLLDKRRKKSGALGVQLPPLGPIGRVLLWVIRGLVVLMMLSLVGAFTFNFSLFWVTVGCLVVYLIVARIFQIVRLAGK